MVSEPLELIELLKQGWEAGEYVDCDGETRHWPRCPEHSSEGCRAASLRLIRERRRADSTELGFFGPPDTGGFVFVSGDNFEPSITFVSEEVISSIDMDMEEARRLASELLRRVSEEAAQ